MTTPEARSKHAHFVHDYLIEARGALFDIFAESEVDFDKPLLNRVPAYRVQLLASLIADALESIERVCDDDDPQAMDTSRWPASGQQTEGE